MPSDPKANGRAPKKTRHWPVGLAEPGDRLPGKWLARRTLRFQIATTLPDGPAKRPSYPMPKPKS